MEKIKENIIKYIKNYVENANSKGVVLGMSGGKDSFIVAKLCTLALGNENVFGIIMPNGDKGKEDLIIAQKECEYLNIKYQTANIENLYNETINLTKDILQTDILSSVSTLNISPRLRMNLLYSVAGTLGYLVANTTNLSERMVGYSTKWGDSVGDFAPLANLTKTEVCKLGLILNLPDEYVNKQPADGLTGKTDEDVLGFSYDELDMFIREGKKGKNFEKILKMHNITAHKRVEISSFKTDLKNYFED